VREVMATAKSLIEIHRKFSDYLGKRDVELQAVSMFLMIASVGRPFPMQDLQTALGLSQASVSRNVALLSVGSLANPGPKLIEAFEDPAYRRRKQVRLAPKGRELMKELQRIISHANSETVFA
jgi:DNA-binding MarR family transcriptional regulator